MAGPLRMKGAEVEVTRLPFGDAAFVGNGPEGTVVPVGIEVKAIQDMLRVISDGRFEGHQLPGMLDAYAALYLIVEGPMRCSRAGDLQIRRGPVWAPVAWGRRIWRCGDVGRWLTRLEVMYGVRVRRTWTRDDTAQAIKDIHDWYEKEEHGKPRDYAGAPPTRSLLPANLTARMVKEIDGIGWDKGRVIGSYFKRPIVMLGAPVQAWMEIPGIGRKLAERAWEAIRSDR